MANPTPESWKAFDDAAKQCTTPDGQALITAMKAFADILNSRLAGIEMALSTATKVLANPPRG